MLGKLANQGIAHILVEGGGETVASFLKTGLVDRMVVCLAPKIIGGRNAPTAVEGKGVGRVKQAIKLEDIKLKKLGSDLIIEGRP